MKLKLILISFVFIISLITSCQYEKGVSPPPDPCLVDTTATSYARDIRPILDNNCTITCHNGRPIYQNDVHLDTYDGVSLRAASGLLYNVTNRVPNYIPMPFGKPKLSCSELAKINSWINQGYKNN